jgi:hypothetical protein
MDFEDHAQLTSASCNCLLGTAKNAPFEPLNIHPQQRGSEALLLTNGIDGRNRNGPRKRRSTERIGRSDRVSIWVRVLMQFHGFGSLTQRLSDNLHLRMHLVQFDMPPQRGNRGWRGLERDNACLRPGPPRKEDRVDAEKGSNVEDAIAPAYV